MQAAAETKTGAGGVGGSKKREKQLTDTVVVATDTIRACMALGHLIREHKAEGNKPLQEACSFGII